MTLPATTAAPMLDALRSDGPDPAHAEKLALYGRFVGSWRADIDFHPPGAGVIRGEGEWHFAWALNGRAIQDVWIFPSRATRDAPRPWHGWGTTFRWYDATIDAWHITWLDPSRGLEIRQIGRAAGADIVQIGENHHGIQRRWRFTEIAPDGFRWIGDVSWDKGASWALELEMRARRTTG